MSEMAAESSDGPYTPENDMQPSPMAEVLIPLLPSGRWGNWAMRFSLGFKNLADDRPGGRPTQNPPDGIVSGAPQRVAGETGALGEALELRPHDLRLDLGWLVDRQRR